MRELKSIVELKPTDKYNEKKVDKKRAQKQKTNGKRNWNEKETFTFIRPIVDRGPIILGPSRDTK
jgi:hypothetical protein